jgi:hypothetical protein
MNYASDTSARILTNFEHWLPWLFGACGTWIEGENGKDKQDNSSGFYSELNRSSHSPSTVVNSTRHGTVVPIYRLKHTEADCDGGCTFH